MVCRDTRGPAKVAQALYEETRGIARTTRGRACDARSGTRPVIKAPETKPDKRARRLIRALGDIDAL